MKQDELLSLLNRFEHGSCSPEELAMLETWFDGASETNTWNWTEDEKQQIKVRLKKQIDFSIRKSTSRSFNNIIKIAASIILISCLGVLLYTYKTTLRNYFDPVIYAQTSVPAGQKMKLTLSDGSVVILNSGSKLRYPKTFNRETRKVYLIEGEAYFDIMHDAESSFIVEAGGVRTQVLGTAFNIRSYSSLKTIDVAVSRGKVAVGKSSQHALINKAQVFLLPGQQVSVNRLTGIMKKKVVNVNEIAGWMNGDLIFSNEMLKNAISILQHSFNIKIQLEQSDIDTIRFSASFNRYDSLNDIMYSIAKANKLKYSIQGRNVFLSRKTNY